ncbi:ATP-binding protein [Lachnospiraceae bacterium OM04-12BH]|jgi:sigma regulatory factor-histidine kinase|uniref:ATP-binding protein n=1 Tax=Suilimivivens sp. TaxID=2981669 RepID=UPI000E568FD6|nr:ATP-binding protein [Lachnospiraceae bacterium OM04-12BH]
MKELTVEAIVEQIETVTEFVNAELEKLDCPMKARIQLDIAIDEIVSNIAYYAYGEKTGTVTVRIEALQEENGVQLMFLDSGVPYDPLTRQDPDISAEIEEREEGGLGIFLVRKTMDDMKYEYKDGQNCLTIRKSF